MKVGTKLVIGGGIIVVATAYMAYLGAQTSWQYYATVDECVANADEMAGNRIRLSGKVAPESLQVAPDHSQATFVIEGTQGKIDVVCAGPLPDNLAEGMDVVVEGQLESDGVLRGDKVLTRCASKYESKEIPASMEDGKPKGTS